MSRQAPCLAWNGGPLPPVLPSRPLRPVPPVRRPRRPGILAYESGQVPENHPDQARVSAAARGDRQAAETLLREALPRVRNLVRYLVRGDSDVEDIAQEALVALLKGMHTYRGDGSFQSWADRIVARTTFAYLKKHRTRAQKQAEHAADLMPVPDEHGAPDQFAARRQAVRMLDQLPAEQRDVLVLHHAVGLGVREISEELSIPFETVRSRLRLGRVRLRSLAGAEDQTLARTP